ncbi:MAG TPA: Do family serine endopeptidase [Caldimonas sp.]|jgi:serine protease Do|nr:Do family serine endopeptidase [Caldimonas sp.]HEX2541219.1 Do family serine endopeptidase [Caldimonas sp.]
MQPVTPRPLLPILALAALCGCSPRPTEQPAATVSAASAPAAPAPVLASSAPVAPPATGVPDFTALMAKVGPAVVNIATSKSVPVGAGASGDPLLDYFRRFAPPGGDAREFRSQGVGSGFVIDAEGHVLTNAHVVADADQVSVRLPDSKREHKARVVGLDRQSDVALLKVDAPGLPVVTLGDSTQLRAGEWVAAIGSPFGLANTITAGIVSAKERSLPDENFVPFIQTDVAVNPGNSGGPLLNTRGEVVGINSQIYSRTGGYMGVSFAIPIGVAMDVAGQLKTQGRVVRGRIGVSIQELSTELAPAFKLQEPKGVLVTTVEPGGPAQRAGVLPGDVILSFDGKPVTDATELPRMVAQAKPGRDVPVEVWRDGAGRTLQVTVAAVEPPKEKTPVAAAGSPGRSDTGRLGLLVRELPAPARRALGVDYGLVIEGVQGVNANAPLEPGDVILAVNNQRFSNFEEFNRLVSTAQPGGTLALLIRRGEATLYVPAKVAAG